MIDAKELPPEYAALFDRKAFVRLVGSPSEIRLYIGSIHIRQWRPGSIDAACMMARKLRREIAGS